MGYCQVVVMLQVLIWRADAGADAANVLCCLRGHSGAVFSVNWSPDGAHVVSAGDDRAVKLWAIPLPLPEVVGGGRSVCAVWSSFGHRARIWCCAFVPTPSADDVTACMIATGSQDGLAMLWTRDGEHVGTMTGHDGKHVWCVAGGHSGNVRAFCCCCLWPLLITNGRVCCCRRWQVIVTGACDAIVKVWHTATVQQRHTAAKRASEFELPPCTVAVSLPSNVAVPIPAHSLSMPAQKFSGKPLKEEVTGAVLLSTGDGAIVLTSQGFMYHVAVTDRATSSCAVSFIGRDRACCDVLPTTATACVLKLSPSQAMFAVGHAGGHLSIGKLPCVSEGVHACVPLSHTQSSMSRLLQLQWLSNELLAVSTCSGDVLVMSVNRSSGDVTRLAQYKIPGKAQAVTLHFIAPLSLLVAGTARGALVIYDFNGTASGATSVPLCVAKHVHGRERVRDIQWNGRYLLVGGHTGQIIKFAVHVTSCLCSAASTAASSPVTTVQKFRYDLGDAGGWYHSRQGFHTAAFPAHTAGQRKSLLSCLSTCVALLTWYCVRCSQHSLVAASVWRFAGWPASAVNLL